MIYQEFKIKRLDKNVRMKIRLNEIVGRSIYNLKHGTIRSSQEIRILKLEI
jgi:hypothetical protein